MDTTGIINWLNYQFELFLKLSFLSKSITVASTLLICVILTWFIRHYTSPIAKIPGPRYSLLYGNLKELSNEEYLSHYTSWINEYGLITRIYFWFGSPIVLVADPKAFKRILMDRESNYKRPEDLMGPAKNLLGNGLLTCSKYDHAWQKKMLNPAFKITNIIEFMSTVIEIGNKIKDSWTKELNFGHNQGSAVISVDNYFGAAVSDAIGKFVFNHDFDALGNANHSVLSENISKILSNNYISYLTKLPFFDRIPVHEAKEFRKADHNLNKMLDESLERKKNSQQLDGQAERTDEVQDLLDLLLKVRDSKTNLPLSNHQLRDQLMTFIIAGKDTVGSCLIWSFYCLAKHRHVQDRLREEINNVMTSTTSLTWETLQSMKFLECVVKESLRLYPPVPALERVAINDDVIGGYHIPKGTKIFLLIAAMQRLEKFWKDPLTFNPDRFMKTDINGEAFSYTPFGIGNDACIGRKMALMELKVIIAILVAAFQFDILPECKNVKLVRHLVIQPDRNMVVKISPV